MRTAGDQHRQIRRICDPSKKTWHQTGVARLNIYSRQARGCPFHMNVYEKPAPLVLPSEHVRSPGGGLRNALPGGTKKPRNELCQEMTGGSQFHIVLDGCRLSANC